MNASEIILTNVSFKDGIEIEMKWVVVTTRWVWDYGIHWHLPMRISNRKIFGLHPKVNFSQTIYAFISVVIMLVGPTKVSIMKLKCTMLNRMWQHDFKWSKYFSVQYFCPKSQSDWLGRLATLAMIPDTHGIKLVWKTSLYTLRLF
jgi:hypothetical protein